MTRRDPLDDTISVIFPSPTPPHDPITDQVTRREFYGRMDGTGAADMLRKAGRDVRLIALMEPEALHQWLVTSPDGAR